LISINSALALARTAQNVESDRKTGREEADYRLWAGALFVYSDPLGGLPLRECGSDKLSLIP